MTKSGSSDSTPETRLHKAPEVVLQLPDLAARAAAVARRVHYNGVIAPAASNLPLDELGAVVHYPADGPVRHAGGGGVLLGPGDHALGGVHVADARPGGEGGDGGGARVREEVQNADLPARPTLIFAHYIVPVCSLLRENARVLEVHGLYVEA